MSSKVFITMMMWIKPDGEVKIKEFKEKAQELFHKYEIKVERSILITAKGQLIGENKIEKPSVIQIISVSSLENFKNYVADPEYKKLSAIRDEGLDRMVATVGTSIPTEDFNPHSDSLVSERLYVVAFTNFSYPSGDGILEFNQKASELFKKYGMHVESMSDVKNILYPLGEKIDPFNPQRTIVFFLDNAATMSSYINDPEYKELAPLRDRGLITYDFFIGKSS